MNELDQAPNQVVIEPSNHHNCIIKYSHIYPPDPHNIIIKAQPPNERPPSAIFCSESLYTIESQREPQQLISSATAAAAAPQEEPVSAMQIPVDLPLAMAKQTQHTLQILTQN